MIILDSLLIRFFRFFGVCWICQAVDIQYEEGGHRCPDGFEVNQ